MKNQVFGLFEISVSRTLSVPAAAIFSAFFEPSRRSAWCHRSDYNVRGSARPSGLRIAWPDGSLVVVSITRQGNSRSKVTVQHGKLMDEAAAATAKQQWSDSLDRLRSMMDG
jgi:hypothetical protein